MSLPRKVLYGGFIHTLRGYKKRRIFTRLRLNESSLNFVLTKRGGGNRRTHTNFSGEPEWIVWSMMNSFRASFKRDDSKVKALEWSSSKGKDSKEPILDIDDAPINRCSKQHEKTYQEWFACADSGSIHSISCYFYPFRW